MIRAFSGAVKLISIAALALLVISGSAWFLNYYVTESAPDDLGETVTIEVTEEDTASTVADKLVDEKLIRFKVYFETRMRLDGGELKPGSYEIARGLSVPEIVDMITVPDDGENDEAAETTDDGQTADTTFNVTFIEGQRIEENAAALEAAGMEGGAEEYIASARDVDAWREAYPFLADVPEGGTLEGFLFPNTYRVGEGASAADVIDLQLSQFQEQFTGEMAQAAEAEGLSVYEAVTLASLVEREAQLDEERPMIAEVYLNRLETGMILGADPAQQYAVGTAEEWWPVLNTELLDRSYNSPYDTYTRQGLPVAPIANPGYASLQSVVQPSSEGYMFFVTAGDESGRHVFTFTEDEHNAATCREHPEYEQCGGDGGLVFPTHALTGRRAA